MPRFQVVSTIPASVLARVALIVMLAGACGAPFAHADGDDTSEPPAADGGSAGASGEANASADSAGVGAGAGAGAAAGSGIDAGIAEIAGIDAEAPGGGRLAPLRNVEIVDRTGASFSVAGLHRVSGDDRFLGYLGAAQIEVGYERLTSIELAPAHAGGRPRAILTLRGGEIVSATYDEREAEQILVGFAAYGRVSVAFRDVHRLRFRGRTRRADLPVYGEAAPLGMDVRVTDRLETGVELVRFRRASVENVVPGIRGAATIAIPMRVIARMTIVRSEKAPADLLATVRLGDGARVDFRIPAPEEQSLYLGEAAFGAYRIHLGDVRELAVRRSSPRLRDLDPLAAARGRAESEDDPSR
jgi:hypothetical protein